MFGGQIQFFWCFFSQKDDSGPKISSLQAEIRRLERLLAATKETEAGLRGEIGDLQARLEVLGQKEVFQSAFGQFEDYYCNSCNCKHAMLKFRN